MGESSKCLDEEEITKSYLKGRISYDKYRSLIRNIQETRHCVEIEGKNNKMSMSSTKWK
jgi:hypothetical protein